MKPEISIAWARKHIDCTPEGRKVCKGRCCKFKNGHGRYSIDDMQKLPKDLQDRLERKGDLYYCKSNNGVCDFIDICIKRPEIKPVGCKLYPFVFNRKGRLVFFKGVHTCPNFNKGNKTAFENCKNDLIDLFGEDWYETTLQLL